MLAQGGAMLEDLDESAVPDLERLCQGVSASGESCTYPATVHCPTCDLWFCDLHAEEEAWHSCLSKK